MLINMLFFSGGGYQSLYFFSEKLKVTVSQIAQDLHLIPSVSGVCCEVFSPFGLNILQTFDFQSLHFIPWAMLHCCSG